MFSFLSNIDCLPFASTYNSSLKMCMFKSISKGKLQTVTIIKKKKIPGLKLVIFLFKSKLGGKLEVYG